MMSLSSPSREPFEKAYKVGHVLGKGGFGIVYAGVRNRDGLRVAIKHIARAKIKDWGQVRRYAKMCQRRPGCTKLYTRRCCHAKCTDTCTANTHIIRMAADKTGGQLNELSCMCVALSRAHLREKERECTETSVLPIMRESWD